jgi:hypothetical protein
MVGTRPERVGERLLLNGRGKVFGELTLERKSE